jgi:hypothetical protein
MSLLQVVVDNGKAIFLVADPYENELFNLDHSLEIIPGLRLVQWEFEVLETIERVKRLFVAMTKYEIIVVLDHYFSFIEFNMVRLGVHSQKIS